MSSLARRRVGFLLCLVFVSAMVMGPGPGTKIAWVNQPEPSLLGLPRLYVWGIAWYFVQVAVVVAAYCLVWRDPDTEGALDLDEAIDQSGE